MRYQFNKFFLLSGSDLKLSDNFIVRHPRGSDILSLGGGVNCEDMYWLYVVTMMSEPYDNMVWLDDRGIDYESVSPFYVFCLKWLDAKDNALSGAGEKQNTGAFLDKVFSEALSFFLGPRSYDLTMSGDRFVVFDKDDTKWNFSEDEFNLVHDFLSVINRLDGVDRIHPANQMAKRMLIEDTRDEQKKRHRRKRKASDVEYLGESASTLLFSGCVPSVDSMLNLGVYAILSGGHAVNSKMRVTAMLSGVYNNKIKADSVSSEDLRWSK